MALALYRAPEVVDFVLCHAPLPAGATRVAIALDHGARSPHVIVTRTGRFVTCLGEEMGHGRSPVVTRAQIDGAFLCVARLLRRPLAAIRPLSMLTRDPHAPCACGSGRRRKRCCGDAPPAPLPRAA
jgi:hypothetical protein